jgi:ketosteroid isomerase-like protein
MVNEQTVTEWVNAYVRAWESNSPQDIGTMFTDDAVYYTAPHREPWRGREGIVAGWIDHQDEPGEWTFRHELVAVAGDLAFVRGWTDYADGDRFSNLWVIRLEADGRCSEFTEWWMEIE